MAEKPPLIFNLLFMDKLLLTLVKSKNKQEKKRTNSIFMKDKIEYNKYIKTINVLEAYLDLHYNLTI